MHINTHTHKYTARGASQQAATASHTRMGWLRLRSQSEPGEKCPCLYRMQFFSQEKYDQKGTSKIFMLPFKIIALIKAVWSTI